MDTEDSVQINENIPIQNFSTLKDCVDTWLKHHFIMDDFPKIVEGINSNDLFFQHFGVIGIRKLLSIGTISRCNY